MFEVILSPEAEEFYAAADRPLARKLARCFAQLEGEPRRHNNIKRLSGELAGLLRYRVVTGESCIGLTIKRLASWFSRLHTAEKSTNDRSQQTETLCCGWSPSRAITFPLNVLGRANCWLPGFRPFRSF